MSKPKRGKSLRKSLFRREKREARAAWLAEADAELAAVATIKPPTIKVKGDQA